MTGKVYRNIGEYRRDAIAKLRATQTDIDSQLLDRDIAEVSDAARLAAREAADQEFADLIHRQFLRSVRKRQIVDIIPRLKERIPRSLTAHQRKQREAQRLALARKMVYQLAGDDLDLQFLAWREMLKGMGNKTARPRRKPQPGWFDPKEQRELSAEVASYLVDPYRRLQRWKAENGISCKGASDPEELDIKIALDFWQEYTQDGLDSEHLFSEDADMIDALRTAIKPAPVRNKKAPKA